MPAKPVDTSVARASRPRPGGTPWLRLMFFALLFSTGIARACPLCKDSAPVTDGRSDDAVTDAAAVNFNGSIYGLLGGVALAAGVVGVAMVKAGRSSK
jgi:hypothetical protein